ncbi:glutamine-hydrolyzing carbamoyl-phosphate synthase small subunit [Candidatus Sumerlaeota bacterium]|nr:glutamine-hydrolyzing carbamoyl-phosphate synthase small subunit [Candidatus Sumerlaeota bacterium]
MSLQKAILVLEDGTVFEGNAFGAAREVFGETVFNTSMTGYQEILTDPSYYGQMVVMTYPLIGNYGINEIDVESEKPQVTAFIAREISGIPSNWRSRETLSNYLARHDIPGIEGIDTRALVLHIRRKGAMRGGISALDLNPERLLEKTLASPQMIGQDYVYIVSSDHTYQFLPRLSPGIPPDKEPLKIVAYDFGIKRNICELMVDEGMEVTVLPSTTKAEEVEALKPDGVFLSNGPGDPAALDYIIREVKELIGKYPIFGICLGHQILGHVFGGKTYKLKFGHRGANHPVKDMTTGKIEITVQNHGFCVDPESLPSNVEITHWNLNDQTVEGMAHRELPVFCVQYHPEASAGPHDARHLFGRFREMIINSNKS